MKIRIINVSIFLISLIVMGCKGGLSTQLLDNTPKEFISQEPLSDTINISNSEEKGYLLENIVGGDDLIQDDTLEENTDDGIILTQLENNNADNNGSNSPINPEPATLIMFFLSLLGLSGYRFFYKK